MNCLLLLLIVQFASLATAVTEIFENPGSFPERSLILWFFIFTVSLG